MSALLRRRLVPLLPLLLLVLQRASAQKCYKRGQEKPMQTCEQTPCNGAMNEYPDFHSCCYQSFKQLYIKPLKGDGVNSMACYNTPGVNDAPCWMPARKGDVQCYRSLDQNECYAGRWRRRPAVQADAKRRWALAQCQAPRGRLRPPCRRRQRCARPAIA
jgi:hypothetical protein